MTKAGGIGYGMLLLAQVVGAGALIFLAANGHAPAWAGWTVGIVFAASFVIPEALGPIPVIVCLGALLWSIVILLSLAAA